jgi:hypothetical protein
MIRKMKPPPKPKCKLVSKPPWKPKYGPPPKPKYEPKPKPSPITTTKESDDYDRKWARLQPEGNTGQQMPKDGDNILPVGLDLVEAEEHVASQGNAPSESGIELDDDFC